MTTVEFVSTITISIISLVIAVWAVKISLKGNGLLMTLTKSIQTIESRGRVKRSGNNKEAKTTKEKEIQLKEQTEQRRALELELKRQQQEWKKKKDVANLIKWFLDRIENEED